MIDKMQEDDDNEDQRACCHCVTDLSCFTYFHDFLIVGNRRIKL